MDIQLTAAANLFMRRAYENLKDHFPENAIDSQMLRDRVCYEIDSAFNNRDQHDLNHIKDEAEAFINKTRWKYCLRIIHHGVAGSFQEVKQFFSSNEEATEFLKSHGFSIQILSKRWYKGDYGSSEFDTATVSRI